MAADAAEVLLVDYGLAVSDEGARCARLLSAWLGGLHHFPGGDKALRRTRWDSFFVELTLPCVNLDTFDGDRLTRLVFLAHDHCIRVDLSPAMRRIRLMLHPRRARTGGMGAHHPTLEAAVAAHREYHAAKDTGNT